MKNQLNHTTVNTELDYHISEIEKRTAELILAIKELASQNDEKEKRAAELIMVNKELKKAEELHKEYIRGIKKIMFITSHKVRQPIANIIGLSQIIDLVKDSQQEIQNTLDLIIESAISLDLLTKELNEHVLLLNENKKYK